MSATIQYLLRTFRNLLTLGLIALGAPQSPLLADARPCATVVPLAAGETWRDPGRAIGDAVCFDLELDAAGIAALDVATSATAARVRLSLRDTAVTRLKQSTTSLIFAAGAGSYRLRVEAEDPRQGLSSFRLRASFVTGGLKSETDSEIEVDPEPFADPIAGLYDLAGARKALGGQLVELCRQGERDDHADAFACATPLAWNDPVSGEIGNDWGDDVDVFRFRVKTLTAVEIEAQGDPELMAEVYDRHGQRLDLAIGDGLRRVRTLAPGAYFLRLEGRDGAAGRYSLRVGPPVR